MQLPSNCKAIIQTNVDFYKKVQYANDGIANSIEKNCGENGRDAYKNGQNAIDGIMNSIERNCGENGYSW